MLTCENPPQLTRSVQLSGTGRQTTSTIREIRQKLFSQQETLLGRSQREMPTPGRPKSYWALSRIFSVTGELFPALAEKNPLAAVAAYQGMLSGSLAVIRHQPDTPPSHIETLATRATWVRSFVDIIEQEGLEFTTEPFRKLSETLDEITTEVRQYLTKNHDHLSLSELLLTASENLDS